MISTCEQSAPTQRRAYVDALCGCSLCNGILVKARKAFINGSVTWFKKVKYDNAISLTSSVLCVSAFVMGFQLTVIELIFHCTGKWDECCFLRRYQGDRRMRYTLTLLFFILYWGMCLTTRD